MSQTKSVQDLLLTQSSSAYIPEGMIADSLFPMITSKQSTGKLAKYGKTHLQLEMSVVGGRGAYRRVEPITRDTAGFTIKGHGLEGLVTQDDYRNVSEPFKAEEDETLGLTTLLAIEKEYLVSSQLRNTGNLTQNTTLAGQSQFSDYLNSDPVKKFLDARKAVINGCGMAPNVVVMELLTYDVLRFHPQMLDYLGYKQNRPGGLTVEELAKALGVEKLMIGQGRYNSAKEGQTASFSALWGKDIIFAVLPSKAAPYQTSLGYKVQYEGSTPRKVYKYAVNNPPESLGILCEDSYTYVLTDTTAAYLIKNAVA